MGRDNSLIPRQLFTQNLLYHCTVVEYNLSSFFLRLGDPAFIYESSTKPCCSVLSSPSSVTISVRLTLCSIQFLAWCPTFPHFKHNPNFLLQSFCMWLNFPQKWHCILLLSISIGSPVPPNVFAPDGADC